MNEFVCDVCGAEFTMDVRYGMVDTCTECGSEEGPHLVRDAMREARDFRAALNAKAREYSRPVRPRKS